MYTKNTESETAKCIICQSDLSVVGGCTTNITRHARNHHPDEYEKVKSELHQTKKKQPTMNETVSKCDPYPLNSEK